MHRDGSGISRHMAIVKKPPLRTLIWKSGLENYKDKLHRKGNKILKKCSKAREKRKRRSKLKGKKRKMMLQSIYHQTNFKILMSV